MELAGEYIFDGTREQVWNLVRDPDVLASALPGTQKLEQVSENEYEGRMHVRIGPVSGVFSGKLQVKDEVEPESLTLIVEGRGAPGFMKGSGKVKLSEEGENQTRMSYTGEVQLGGKLAGVGQRLLDSVSKSMVRQGLDSMNAILVAPPAVESEGMVTPEVAVAPPPPKSEAEFAVSVFRDVVNDFLDDVVTPENKPLLVGAFIALVSVIIGYSLGKKHK